MYSHEEKKIMQQNLERIEEFCRERYVPEIQRLGITVTVPVAKGRRLVLFPDGDMYYHNGRVCLYWDRSRESNVYDCCTDMEERIEAVIAKASGRRKSILEFEL